LSETSIADFIALGITNCSFLKGISVIILIYSPHRLIIEYIEVEN